MLIKLAFFCKITTVFMFSIIGKQTHAQPLFPTEITSYSWAPLGQCSSDEKRYFIFESGFRGPNILCASTDSSRDGSNYYLFMECSVGGNQVTYMGPAHFHAKFFMMDLLEYRAATGAPELFLELERCDL